MRPMELKIDGMSCGHCVARVEKALKQLEGVAVGKVRVGHAELLYDPAKVTAQGVLAAVEEAGYPAQVVEPVSVLA